MGQDFLAGIDIGTTGAKTSIFTVSGELMSSAYREYGCTYPKPGWVEQDLTMLLNESMNSCAEAVSKLGSGKSNIRSVSFSTQRTCTIFLDIKGELIRPMISWQDNRTDEEVEIIRKELGSEQFHTITGLPLNTTWNLSKILWLKRNEPLNWKRVTKISQLQDFIIKNYGADDYYVDKAAVSLYGLYDLKESKWSNKILNMFSIDSSLLPKVVTSGTKVGTISKSVSEKTGLPEGTPICVGAGDQNSAAVGAGVVSDGIMSISLGTGGLVAAYLSEYPQNLDEAANIMNHAIDGKWELEGYQAGAASVYRWFKDEIAGLQKAYAESTNKNPYEIINEMVANVPAGSKGLLFLPYLASACAPRWNSNARGTLIGLTFAHDKACLARAFMEGITLEIKDMLKSMSTYGVKPKTIRILGGPTKSEIWNQMQSDIYNRPVETLKFSDAAVLGAAIFAGLGVGIFDDIKEAVKLMVSIDKTYTPDKINSDLYEELYEIYCSTYSALTENGTYKKISEFQKRYN